MARKILLADDSVTAQNMGRKILADAGYEVITVNNGSAALKKVNEHKPDLIVLDVYMPGYSGLEVCQRLKEAGDTSHIPILLTVGKLEPFKPEEARRVRADAFIVKPFEASELLSALSKLEDKVVPRSEHSKPGRFARATAAIDEGRFDRSMAVEEDSGWKSRIVFPKKKEKEPEPEVDDPAVYNPVNKDLRTVVEHKPEEHPPVATHESEPERVNLSALAPEGLPKDVTPEEIAALAAAAAQVKGKIAGENPVEEKRAEKIAETPAVTATEPIEAKTEIQKEAPVPESPLPVVANGTVPEQAAPVSNEAEVASSAAEVTQATAHFEQKAADEPKEPVGAWAEAAKSEEPVTMAAAAAAGANGSKWAAVAVALSPEEASLSLEQEMQMAASFAVAAEPERFEIPASASSEPLPVTVAMTDIPPSAAESATPEIQASTATLPVEEAAVAPAFAETSASADNTNSSGDEFSAPAAVDVPSGFSTSEPSIPETTSVVAAEPVSATAPTLDTEVPAQAPEGPMAEPAKSEIESVEAHPVAVDAVAPSIPHDSTEELPKEAQAQVAAPELSASEESSRTSESVQEEAVDASPASHSGSGAARGHEQMANKESEITATTAAAWASWRKIRETGHKPAEEDAAELKDESAKAVAAGAESNPDEVSELDSDPEIANIVDSVLADMRPKIVQEIAKKLGKKK